MYNDTIKVANKIITDSDLAEIFQKMDEDMKKNQELCKQETILNEKYEREYQHWTVKSFEGKFNCTYNFYDDTNITVDNYNSFNTIFNNRLHEVKSMYIRFHYIYWIQNGKDDKMVSQSINMDIYEHKMNIDVNLSSDDNKMNDIFELIKQKILSAPERYDRVIKNKSSISNKIGFALGMIPSLVIFTILAVVPEIRNLYGLTFVLYPIAVAFLAFIVGSTIFNGKLDRLYEPLNPQKKYAGYDSYNQKSMYKDDIEDYVSTSEIIIGKNIDNLKNRQEIVELESKYSKYIPIELIVLSVLSVIMIIIGRFIK